MAGGGAQADSADDIARLVRAMDPRPGAWSTLGGRELKLFGPQPGDPPAAGTPPGRVMETDPALVVATGRGALQFLDVQPAGRTRMAAHAWGRGRGVAKDEQLE